MAVNPDKLNAFMGKAVGDIGAALSANMVLLGDKLGLQSHGKGGPRHAGGTRKGDKDSRTVRP